MASTYWLKQSTEPLFPELIWSRPEHKASAGKLLIIGGNSMAVGAPATAYNESLKAGAGSVRVLLPDTVKKAVGPILRDGEFTPSTPSGSFSQKSLADWLDHSQWADGVLIAGDLGRNSETAIVQEKFVDKYNGQLTVTQDAVDYFINLSPIISNRPKTSLVLSFAQLQKLAQTLGFSTPFTFSMDLIRLVESLHEFTSIYPVLLVTKHLDQIIITHEGLVSTTHNGEKIWRVETAAHASVWWLQNPTKPFEASTTAVFETTHS